MDIVYETNVSLIVLILIIIMKDLTYWTLLPFWSEEKNKNALLNFLLYLIFK